jgi:dGTPase
MKPVVKPVMKPVLKPAPKPVPVTVALQAAVPSNTAARAAYAADAAHSRGRALAEPACPMRTPFQRDRDRIVHATAFRRLTHKTQVFLYHEGDHYRTRLTHTIEVAQIARAIARQLRLDEDLTEALALAHDLGHPPFGHAGERALDAAMADHGGFDHNAQSFKVVTRLERKYAKFDGLNLSLETLEGLVKHNGPLTGPDAHEARPGEHRILLAEIARAGLSDALRLNAYASAEAQAAAVADDIAYVNHDIDDALRAGLLEFDALADVPLVGPFVVAARETGGDAGRRIYEVNRRLITVMIEDVVQSARSRIAELQPTSSEQLGNAAMPVVAFSPALHASLRALKSHLLCHVYRHDKVMSVMHRAEAIVTELFRHYMQSNDNLPQRWVADIGSRQGADRAALICDFVAGMTDRYAIEAHQRLFDHTPELR